MHAARGQPGDWVRPINLPDALTSRELVVFWSELSPPLARSARAFFALSLGSVRVAFPALVEVLVSYANKAEQEKDGLYSLT